jgi:hypothetical protein
MSQLVGKSEYLLHVVGVSKRERVSRQQALTRLRFDKSKE